MGQLADEVCVRLRNRLAKRLPDYSWELEGRIGGTPVDLLGSTSGRVVAVELE